MSLRFHTLPASLLLVGACALAGCSSFGNAHYKSRPKVAKEIAAAYNFKNWNQVERIKFTFNYETDDRKVRRAWVWDPKTRAVTLKVGDEPAMNFSLDDVTEPYMAAHRDFINDTYWLLFPYYLVWSDAKITDSGDEMTLAPISGRELRTVVASYSAAGGYTPGDTYMLYIDDKMQIVEWVFKRPLRPDIPATWNPPQPFGPLMLSTRHHIPANNGLLHFTDVEVIVTPPDKKSSTSADAAPAVAPDSGSTPDAEKTVEPADAVQ